MNPTPKPDLFDRIRSIARVLLVLYVPGVLFTGLALFGYFAYGLEHAAEGTARQFFVLLVMGVAAAIGLGPLVLLPGRSALLRFLQSVGMLMMLAGGAAAGKAAWYALLEPALMTYRFNSAMSELSIQAVHERPLYVEGKLAGLHLALDVRINHDIKLNRYGAPSLDVLNTSQIVLAQPRTDAGAPLQSYGEALRTKDGKPIETLPGFKPKRSGAAWLDANAVLPAGLETPYLVGVM